MFYYSKAFKYKEFGKFELTKSDVKKKYWKFFKVRLKLQNFPRILQNYLIFNAFFSKTLVKSKKIF